MRAWRDHERELRGWLHRRLGNGSDAEDQLQELFLKALRQGERFCELHNARAWLFEVARNAVADRLRVAREQVELPEDLAAEEVEHPPVEDLISCLPRVLSELRADDREAIVLCDLQGMTQEQYAQHAGLTLPGAKSRVQRARKRLRARMTEACRVRLDSSGHVSDFVPRPPLA
jgi:RNA polymerase sigma-70 factor (ECF subfamily)